MVRTLLKGDDKDIGCVKSDMFVASIREGVGETDGR